MAIKDGKHRFVVIIDKDIFEQFKSVAASEQRSASNLASKIITDYTKSHQNHIQ